MALISHGEWLDRFGDDLDDGAQPDDDLFDTMSFTVSPVAAASHGLPVDAHVLPSMLWSGLPSFSTSVSRWS